MISVVFVVLCRVGSPWVTGVCYGNGASVSSVIQYQCMPLQIVVGSVMAHIDTEIPVSKFWLIGLFASLF